VLLDLAKQGKRFLTIEHNMGQMVEDVRLSIRTVADSAFHCQLPGNLPTPDDFEEPI
jgi:2-oxoglutarate/2-oxoacid ferredoxin oxidoreductase subunit alpha